MPLSWPVNSTRTRSRWRRNGDRQQNPNHSRATGNGCLFCRPKGGDYNARYRQAENQQEKVKTEIRQLENRQKILLNRKTDAERKARTRRLIEHGAILESIFPAATAMTGEEIKAFLSAISCLPEVVRLLKNKPKSQDMQQP